MSPFSQARKPAKNSPSGNRFAFTGQKVFCFQAFKTHASLKTMELPAFMQNLTPEQLIEIRTTVCTYFADECDVDVATITDSTNIIDDLEGDSLMLLSLLELFRKKHGLSIELKTLGKHLMKKPASTVGEVIDLTTRIVAHGDAILSIDL